jgi:hypothetical protein
MATSVLEQKSSIPSQGSDRQPSAETLLSGEVAGQVQTGNMTEPESHVNDDLLLEPGVLIL